MTSTSECLWCSHPLPVHEGMTLICRAAGCACAGFRAREVHAGVESVVAMKEVDGSAHVPEQLPGSDAVGEVEARAGSFPSCDEREAAAEAQVLRPRAVRERLSGGNRPGHTRVFRLPYRRRNGDQVTLQLYLTANTYPDGRPAEVFIKADKQGSLTSGALDACAIMMSMLLQYGVPLGEITSKLRHTRYPPDGFTGDEEFRSCTSPLDLVAQWLDARFSR